MTREKKFRAWAEDTKIMSAPFTLQDAMNNSYPLSVDDSSIILQYTGHDDKNGKEVCEGDLIKGEGGTLLVIKYRTGSTCYIAQQHNVEKPWSNIVWWADAEVVGNIYENPELLKK